MILPTYREAANLPTLIPEISQVLDAALLSHEIIVVDDDSTDGTERLIADLAGRFPVRLLVRRDQRGLASAVVHGFNHARGEILVCMDADGSHPPTSVPELVGAVVEGGAARGDGPIVGGVAVGSRFIVGGSTDDHWPLLRRLNSAAATWPARLLTGLRDPMSGFFALQRDRFKSIPPQTIRPIGYKILLELIVKTNARRCIEIPIHFRQRAMGRSKLSLKVQAAYVWQLVRLMTFRLRTVL